MKFFIILAVYFSLNISSAFADNNLKEERDKITKERNDLAIGWRDNLGYSLPIPGSYQLYNIGKAGDGEVVDGIGDSVRLHELMDGKITLLSFIYSNCTDTNGCPLATSVFYKIQEKLKMDKKVLSKLKMISLSFDPEYDTPEIMNLYGKDLSYIDADWSFLTTDSSRKLDPILS